MKDVIEEALLLEHRDLFTGLDCVSFDTPSIYFEGEGGATIGELGYSKDHRPDLNQMVVGVILDDHGQPVCVQDEHYSDNGAGGPQVQGTLAGRAGLPEMKSVLDTRPIFHQRDETIRGHVFCSFLVLVLRKELDRRLEKSDEDRGKTLVIRSECLGTCGKVSQAVGVAIPPTIREVA